MTACRAACAAFLLTLVLSTAACGGDDDSASDTSETTAADSTTTTAAETTSSTTEVTEVTEAAGADNTTQGAIARFEQYLHALGSGDIGTICEIAGPAAQVAEDQGAGPCESTFGAVMGMISPEQSAALRTATVDPGLVDETTPGQVHVPVDAVVSSATFTESDLGSYTLAYQNGNWFIID
jgi:hypothetical protein